VLAPDIIAEVFGSGGLTNTAGTGGTGGAGDELPESDKKKEPRGSVAESWRTTPLRCRELRRSYDESTNEEPIKARARVVPEIEERLSDTEGEGWFTGAPSASGWVGSGGGTSVGTAECPI